MHIKKEIVAVCVAKASFLSFQQAKSHNSWKNKKKTQVGTLHENYTAQLPYAYKVQYYNKSQPKCAPFELKDNFLPKIRLPPSVIPSIDAICNLSLLD